MAVSYMEMIYIDDSDNARQTNVRAAMKTNALTWAAFKSYRRLDVGKKRAKFLLDYYNADGDLGETICLNADGFAAISMEPVLSNAAYVQIDKKYWRDAVAERTAASVRQAA